MNANTLLYNAEENEKESYKFYAVFQFDLFRLNIRYITT